MIIAAITLGIVSCIHFMNSSGVNIEDTSDSSPNVWERDLIWFTYRI